MPLLTRLKLALAVLLGRDPRPSNPGRSRRILDLMERRMDDLERRDRTAYDPRIEREGQQPWTS